MNPRLLSAAFGSVDRRFAILLLLFLLPAPPQQAQRGAKAGARELFYSEAGLIVSPEGARKGRFAAAKRSVIAITLGLKYRIWKLSGSQTVEADPAGPFRPGDQLRLEVEINDTGYLYVVHRQPSGTWRRLFPSPEIERGNNFIHSGVTYPIPSEEGLELQFASGMERFFLVLSRAPVKDLERLLGPPQPENTVSASAPPEISEAVVEGVRNLLNSKELLTERDAQEKSVYMVNRTGKADSLVVAEIKLTTR